MIPASHAHVRLLVLLAAGCALATLAGSAQAQGVDFSLPPLANLTIVSEYDPQGRFQVRWDVTVTNSTVGAHPGTHVHLVKVRITLSDPVRGATTQIWTILNLPVGGSATRQVYSEMPAVTEGPEKVAQRLHAEIIESDPVELPRLRSNSSTEHWAIMFRSGGSDFTNGDVGVDLASISDRFPQPGGTATFTVGAYNISLYIPGLILASHQDDTVLEVQVEISLSPGLSFAGSQPEAPTGTSFDTTTGIWDLPTIGPRPRDNALSLPVAVNLASESLSDLPLEERCLTARVVSAAPWFASDISKRVNDSFTACLGESLLTEGETALFDYHDCVGVTSSPCTSADKLEVVVQRGGVYLQPETVVVHVREPQGRVGAKWRTGRTEHHASSVADTPGVEATFSFLHSVDMSGWTNYSFAIRDVSPKQRPGAVKILGGDQGTFTVLDADTKKSLTTNLPASITDNPYPVLLEFSTLGTHQVQLTLGATKSSTAYPDTGTYTFHVGPVADLEVRDAGASPEVGGSQRAYTIMAAYNGPEPVAPDDVLVTLTGVPQGAQAIASEGSYSEGTCVNGLCAGVWIIGDLRRRDSYRHSGLGGPPTLTLVTDRGGDPVTANIGMEDYCVRIKTGDTGPEIDLGCAGNLPTGYTEHTAAYYDHNDGNNTATVQARAGTASEARAAGAPRSLRVRQFGIIAIVSWEAMYPREVNGYPVTHFHLERSGVIVENDLLESVYVDMQGDVNQSYRVRAVNEFGVPGPWSERAGAGIGELGAPYDLIATPARDEGRIDLQWRPSASDHVDYRIDHSDSGTDPWRVLAIVHDGTDYVHDGLAPQTTHYYRVAAVRDTLISAWVYALETTQPDPDYVAPVDTVHTVPSEPRNLRFSSLDRTAVTLAWEPPADDGGARVTGYEYWVTGPCASDPSAICDVVLPTRVSGTSRAISGLDVVGTYYFQVRAFNAAGAGPWTQGIAKEVNAPPQDPAPGGGRVIFSPSRVTVPEGGSVTYRVKLTSSPTQPLWVALYWDGDYDMGTELPGEQFKTLLPSNYPISGLIGTHCPSVHGVYRWGAMAFRWDEGVPITVTALEDDDRENGRLIIEHDIFTVPADCLGNPTNYAPDPVYDGMYGLALEVTERDND